MTVFPSVIVRKSKQGCLIVTFIHSQRTVSNTEESALHSLCEHDLSTHRVMLYDLPTPTKRPDNKPTFKCHTFVQEMENICAL